MADNNQERLNQAIRLSQLGEKQEARKILLQLIQENSGNEYAWLWLIDVCDSDRERKAVLSRGIKLNPKSKLLQTAMKRFIDTGSLVLEDSLDDLVVEAKVEEIAKKPEPKPARRDPLTTDSSDLDWISLEEETEKEVDTLDTISDEQFSQLSQEFFIGDDEEDSSSFELNFDDFEESEDAEDKEENDLSNDTGSSSGLFLLDEFLAEDNALESKSASQSDPFIDFDDLNQSGTSSEAIEDRLKGAFDDEEDGKKQQKRKKLNIRLPDFKTVSRHALVAIVSAFWLIVFVLAGLFVVQFFDLDQYLKIGGTEIQPTATEMDPVGSQSTDQPSEAEPTIEPTATATPIPVQTNLGKISRFSLDSIVPLESFTQPFPMVLSQSGELNAILDLRTVYLQDMFGEELWKKEIMTARAIGGGFSDDNTLLGVFCDDMTLKIWNVEDGSPINELAISPEMEVVYSEIPYLPQNSASIVLFSADNAYVAAGYWGGVTVWSMETGGVVHKYALAQSVLISSFDASIDLNVSMDFNPNTSEIVYGIRENIFLVDIPTNLTTQNWKTQYAGHLEWIDEERFIEIGYPFNNNGSYIAVWHTDNLSAELKKDSLSASRGNHLPHYIYFDTIQILAYEVAGSSDNKVAVGVISLIDGLELGLIEVDTFQPILGIVGLADESILGIWAEVPKEGFGVEDQVQFWDIDTLELVSTCAECSFLSGIQADQYGVFINDDSTLITQYAQGIGTQQLGVPRQ